MLVDDALSCGTFAGSAGSIRERVLRAELAFRAGNAHAISESTLVRAINDMASVAFASEAFKTSGEQVHAFRMMMNPAMPHFIGTSDVMSPAEAIFITGFLTQQKLYIPNYTLDSQKVADWAASRRSDQTFVDTPEPPRGALRVSSMPREMAEVEAALREQLPHEWSLVTICVHLFLDRAGFPR